MPNPEVAVYRFALGPVAGGQTLNAVGPSTFMPIQPTGVRVEPIGLLANVSNGATLTYNFEVTGDDVQAPGYNPATGNWVAPTGWSGLTSSAVETLGGYVTAVRLNVTSYTSGSVVFQAVQVTP